MPESYSCQQARIQVQEVLDGLETAHSPLESHLDRCPPCRQYQEDHQRLKNLYPVWKVPEASPGFAARTVQKFLSGDVRPAQTPPRERFFTVPIAAAASFLFLIGFSLLVWQRGEMHSPSSDRATLRISRSHLMDDRRDHLLLGISMLTSGEAETAFPFGQ